MKYDLEVSLSDSNNSHALVVELVGVDKRVLDVGCSTGALARVLKTRGNRVSGVELDPEAAQLAEPDLEQLVVGDVETLDLADHFAAGSFDVIVFADVLEHLRDPIQVLRAALSLLAPGGSVVVSLPNIAHGSVRLALLEGRFEYRPLGLLDDTHLRFFTRRSVGELLDASGLIPTEMWRTTADAFATEIPLSPADFPADLVARVRAQPDSDTYQFVLRAVPVHGTGSTELAAELLARNEELQALRSQVREIVAAAATQVPQHIVALLVEEAEDGGQAWASLRNAVTAQEVRRRLDGAALQHLRIDRDTQPATWRGDPVATVDPGDEASVDLAADVYDAILVTDGRSMVDAAPFVEGLTERGVPVVPFAAAGAALETVGNRLLTGWVRAAPEPVLPRGGLAAVPDPLILANRLVGGDSLPLRLQYLRRAGRMATEDGYLLAVVSSQANTGTVTSVVADLASEQDCAVVVVPYSCGGGHDWQALTAAVPGSSVLEDPQEIDLLALVYGARSVVTDVGPAAAVALAMERPLLAFGTSHELSELAAWTEDPDLVAATPAELLGRTGLATQRASDQWLLRRLRDPLEMAYDELGTVVAGAAARQLALSISEILRFQQSRIGALERANLALQSRLVAERNALGARASSLMPPGPSTADRSGPPDGSLNTQLWIRQEIERRADAAEQRAVEDERRADQAERRADEAERRADALQAEIDATMATKTMRVLAPGRRLYGVLRRTAK